MWTPRKRLRQILFGSLWLVHNTDTHQVGHKPLQAYAIQDKLCIRTYEFVKACQASANVRFRLNVKGLFTLQEHINVRDQLIQYLNGKAKLITTRCIIMETEKIAKKTHGALTILKQFGTHECNHKQPVSGSQCILSMVGKKNENHYILATQDRDLQEKLRLKPGVPLLYLHNKAPTLEKPSKASYNQVGLSLESNKFMFISETQNEALKSMKISLGIENNIEEKKIVLKKKKQKNPNPLSCKKKKKKPNNGQNNKSKVQDGGVKKRIKHKSNILSLS